MPLKRWRIDGNFVASPGEFWLQKNPTVQRAHCAVEVTSNFPGFRPSPTGRITILYSSLLPSSRIFTQPYLAQYTLHSLLWPTYTNPLCHTKDPNVYMRSTGNMHCQRARTWQGAPPYHQPRIPFLRFSDKVVRHLRHIILSMYHLNPSQIFEKVILIFVCSKCSSHCNALFGSWISFVKQEVHETIAW